MKKIVKLCACSVIFGLCFGLGGLLADKQTLKEDIIRLHVIANSDSAEDQRLKLYVRDSIVTFLTPLTQGLDGKEEAMSVLQDNLAQIRKIANNVLKNAGVSYRAEVKLTQEAYDTREYDAFSLPAGIYDSLQIQLGASAGKNWWCVVFPSFCLGATSAEFSEVAAASGFDETMTKTLAGESAYEIRFFFLDCLGRLEKFFY